MLVCIDYFHETNLITSEFLASSIQVNPVIIRRIILQLKSAGMINVNRGRGGVTLVRSLEEINLYEVYKAVDCVNGSLFHFHENPNPDCPVGKNIHNALDETLTEIQKTFEDKLKSFTLKDIAEKII